MNRLTEAIKSKETNEEGVTLVELLLYMGILAILLVVLTEMFVSIVDVQLSSKSFTSVEADGRFMVARITYDINRADSITTPANPGDSSASLILDIGGETYTYALSGDVLQLTNLSGTGRINSTETGVSSPNFQKIGNANSETINMQFTVTGQDIGNSGAQVKTFDVTAGLRD